jgi:dipeptidyl aminopeptidase/acylaminoacyl peptidase
MMSLRSSLLVLLAALAACRPATQPSLPPPQSVSAPAAASEAPTLPAVTPSPQATPTFEPYFELSIPYLAGRAYGGGQLTDLGILSSHSRFTRYLFSYPSDGLVVNGFVDIPQGSGPFPVVLVLHGYVDPAVYQIETYTARYAAAFANAGYITIHPNYRNYPPSDQGPNEFRVGYATDVLNLIADVNAQAGQPGLLQAANPNAIFLWGHSMGGGISLRVLAVGADVQAALLYGSMSGDERRNFEHIRDVLSEGDRGNEELSVPEAALQTISPIYFYDRIRVPVSIHHGDIDDVVPPAWSQELCTLLTNLGKNVECFSYHNMPHTFYGDNDELLIRRSIEFFERYTP